MTELTIDQAIQQGIEAHKAGQVQEAERFYTAILKAQPKHPDANHNMGVLAVGVGKVQEALPFFKTALEANPTVAAYWISFVDTLIKLDKSAEAKAVLDQAKGKGARGIGFDNLEQRLIGAGEEQLEKSNVAVAEDPEQPNILDTLKLDQALKLAKKRTKEGAPEKAKCIYQDILSKFPANKRALDGIKVLTRPVNKVFKVQDPPQDQLQALVNLYSQGQLQQALKQAETLVEQFPRSPVLFNIQGAVLKGLGQLDLSIEAYNKAIAMKPDYAEAYINLGATLKDQGKLEKAIEAYRKALAIKPDVAEVYNNIGVTLKDQGKFEEAIEAYKKAFDIKPDYTEAWHNIVFPLQSMKLKASSQEKLVSYYPEDIGSNYHRIAKANLNYILNLGGAGAESSLGEALVMLSEADGIVIKNPEPKIAPTGSQAQLTDKVVALVHWGRSGTGLLHSLIDDHSEVSTLPSIYLSEYFDHASWRKIICGGWNHMVENFMAIYDVIFDAKSEVPVLSKNQKWLFNIGVLEGMANVGDQRDEVLRVDKEIFRTELQSLMNFYAQLDALLFFKLVHKAYDKAISDVYQKSLIFYHIHNPGLYAQLNFVRLAPKAKWIMMVREPVQSCESWLKKAFQNNNYTRLTTGIKTMLFDIDNVIYNKGNSIGVRLEDIKERPRQTIPALCNWIGIKESESFYEMTAQGKKWWGDPSSPDFTQDGMNPFGTTSINRKIGSIFSESDQYILQCLFYPFRVRFGYVEANAEQFEIDLQMIRPMLDNMFDFEKAIAKRTHVDPEQFMKSGSYFYLRSVLIERWDVLRQFGTYPNMIKPLSI